MNRGIWEESSAKSTLASYLSLKSVWPAISFSSYYRTQWIIGYIYICLTINQPKIICLRNSSNGNGNNVNDNGQNNNSHSNSHNNTGNNNGSSNGNVTTNALLNMINQINCTTNIMKCDPILGYNQMSSVNFEAANIHSQRLKQSDHNDNVNLLFLPKSPSNNKHTFNNYSNNNNDIEINNIKLANINGISLKKKKFFWSTWSNNNNVINSSTGTPPTAFPLTTTKSTPPIVNVNSNELLNVNNNENNQTTKLLNSLFDGGFGDFRQDLDQDYIGANNNHNNLEHISDHQHILHPLLKPNHPINIEFIENVSILIVVFG